MSICKNAFLCDIYKKIKKNIKNYIVIFIILTEKYPLNIGRRNCQPHGFNIF